MFLPTKARERIDNIVLLVVVLDILQDGLLMLSDLHCLWSDGSMLVAVL